MPLATMQHEMKTATDTRDAMKKKKKDAYVIMKPDKIRRALTDSEIEELRAWMLSNRLTRDNPIKNDEVRMRDIDSE